MKNPKNLAPAVDDAVWREFCALDPDGQSGVLNELINVFLGDTEDTIGSIRDSLRRSIRSSLASCDGCRSTCRWRRRVATSVVPRRGSV